MHSIVPIHHELTSARMIFFTVLLGQGRIWITQRGLIRARVSGEENEFYACLRLQELSHLSHLWERAGPHSCSYMAGGASQESQHNMRSTPVTTIFYTKWNDTKSQLLPVRNRTCILLSLKPVPELIDPVFAKTSPKSSFSVMKNERFRLVFAKTVYYFGHRSSKVFDIVWLKIIRVIFLTVVAKHFSLVP